MSVFIHEICPDTKLQLQEYLNNLATRVLSNKSRRNHGVEELRKNVCLQQLLCFIFIYVEINKFTNVSCTDCFNEAVKRKMGMFKRESGVESKVPDAY